MLIIASTRYPSSSEIRIDLFPMNLTTTWIQVTLNRENGELKPLRHGFMSRFEFHPKIVALACEDKRMLRRAAAWENCARLAFVRSEQINWILHWYLIYCMAKLKVFSWKTHWPYRVVDWVDFHLAFMRCGLPWKHLFNQIWSNHPFTFTFEFKISWKQLFRFQCTTTCWQHLNW